MEIKFKKISLKNFKGILGEKTIQFSDTATSIYGGNHKGKTTIIDAALWVLFDKNSEGASVFGIDTKDEQGNIIPKLEHSVKLIISVDGVEKTLEKVRKDVWSKPRGQEEEVLSGHKTDYFIDGNKYTQTDYKAEIANILPEELFKAITNPMYFPALKAADQRLLLTKMAGETNFADIATRTEEWKLIESHLQNTDLERFKEHLAYKKKEIKKELEQIPSRISEHQMELAPLKEANHNYPIIEERIKQIEVGIKNYDDMLADASKVSDSQYQAKQAIRQQIRIYETERDNIVDTYNTRNRKAAQIHQEEIESIEHNIVKQRNYINQLSEDAERNARRQLSLNAQKETFRICWQQVEDETFAWNEASEYCPTCHQRLPQEDIDSLRQRLEGNFNENKAKKQDRLDEEAASIAKQQAVIDEQAENYQAAKQQAEQRINELSTTLEQTKGSQPQKEDYSTDTRIIELTELIKAEEAKLTELEQTKDTTQEEGIAQIKEQKQAQMKRCDELKEQLRIKQDIERKEQRIAELTTLQRNLSQQLAELEQQEFAAERLTQLCIEDLESRVNKLFENVEFKMFEKQLNGGLKTVCECTMHGTPYQDLSTSEKINAGIDIINAMCRHNNAFAPIMIDNAESITDILPTASQQIRFVVSRDEELVVVNN
jgi:chromosome segregation ATPase